GGDVVIGGGVGDGIGGGGDVVIGGGVCDGIGGGGGAVGDDEDGWDGA
ncbi:hypothetical protein Tco_0696396, partial [Tanacetum coccineum]